MLDKSRVSGWHWVMQRVSALFLAFGLSLHLLVLHYGKLPGGNVMPAATSTAKRFGGDSTFLWVVFDTLLLGCALYHALNGVYNMVMDYNPGPGFKKTFAWVLWAVGLAAFGFGFILIGKFVGFAMAA
mgnify:CR=1 FL=1